MLMADENKKKLNGPLGRAIDIYPGKANKVETGIDYKKKSKKQPIAKKQPHGEESEVKMFVPFQTRSGRLVKPVDRSGQK